jgi:hypothetical protein
MRPTSVYCLNVCLKISIRRKTTEMCIGVSGVWGENWNFSWINLFWRVLTMVWCISKNLAFGLYSSSNVFFFPFTQRFGSCRQVYISYYLPLTKPDVRCLYVLLLWCEGVQCLRLALCKGSHRVDAITSPFLPEDGSRASFRNVVFKGKNHWTMDKVQKQDSSKFSWIRRPLQMGGPPLFYVF